MGFVTHAGSTAQNEHKKRACIPPTAASLAEAKAAVRHTLSQGKAGPPFCTQHLSVNSPYHADCTNNNMGGQHRDEEHTVQGHRMTTLRGYVEQRRGMMTMRTQDNYNPMKSHKQLGEDATTRTWYNDGTRTLWNDDTDHYH
ncbi:uncharacterized protein LACBIDRAFT_331345 [Laccaria bicolor S238N-H82]|uniref:Predicted protein n=1 Tax=Laccaria bicolor (strain S238N-H82 / ATCC MYA-4686) TaxID=486041 RepID=B0DP75_LACBS|nr:uncharacterized protein LACBIDRAFT_331345 [Laccaria bicolor S238N-H82]EDR03565.1 predicted protein [Laccaria bicolor S238N-H82]|eukprot:XP_001885713.1 predicted protein [Laccaria bicolor S238N-H82]